MGDISDARDLWQTQVPYSEPDIIIAPTAPIIRTMVHVAQWKGWSTLVANVTPPSTDIELSGELLVDADVV